MPTTRSGDKGAPAPKQAKAPPKSDAARYAAWYKEHGEAAKLNKIYARIRAGSIPTNASMEKYGITIEDINRLRLEGKLPQINNQFQLSQERGLIKTGKGGTIKHVRANPLPEQVPEHVGPVPAARSYGVARVGGAGAAGGAPKAKDHGKKFDLKELTECINEVMPTLTYRKKREDVPYSKNTIKSAIKAPAAFYRQFKIDPKTPIIADLQANWDKGKNYKKQISEVKGKTGTSDAVMKRKKLVLNITAAAKHCPDFGETFEARAPDILQSMRDSVGEYRDQQGKSAEDISDKVVAYDWTKVMQLAKKGQPKKSADWIDWQNYLLVQLLAGGGEKSPPRRDNYGNMRIVQTMKDVPPKGDQHDLTDYYVRSNEQFVFRSMKTRNDYPGKQLVQNVPKQVVNAIEASLAAKPRDWMITTSDLKKPVGKVTSSRLREAIGMSFNDARHSWISHWAKLKIRSNGDKRHMATLMHTSVDLLNLYIRYGEEVPDDDEFEKLEDALTSKIKKEKNQKPLTDAQLGEFVRVTRQSKQKG